MVDLQLSNAEMPRLERLGVDVQVKDIHAGCFAVGCACCSTPGVPDFEWGILALIW
jgi:hypothetical protein